MQTRGRLTRFGVALVVISSLVTPTPAMAAGQAGCVPSSVRPQSGHATWSSGWEKGTRATIEGENLSLCLFSGSTIPSGSFQWVALENRKSVWLWNNKLVNIVQLGYGKCLNVNNNLDGGTVCNGQTYWYWAWGSYCGTGIPDGTLIGTGPVAFRIGPPMSGTPPTRDVYVIRHSVGGVVKYEGFVNGSLLTGLDALGNTVSASVPASRICWDSDDVTSSRAMIWFGETFNVGDSMGGWNGSTMDHLDYTTQRYTVGTGWLSPNHAFPADCVHADPPTYVCRLSGSDQMFIQTIR
jgi:hypothetical protein